MVKGGFAYRILTDQLGSVRVVRKVSDGSIAQQWTYDAWGAATLVSGTADFQPFGFAGGLYDPDTKLVRFGARDYDPEVGRWTSKDPILFQANQANLYVYVLNDPNNLFDPSGMVGLTDSAYSDQVIGSPVDWNALNQTEAMQGLYGGSGILVVGLAEGALTIAAVPVAVAAPAVTVSRWGRPGLEAGAWVMKGAATWLNYLASGKWQPGMGNEFAPYACGKTYVVPRGTLVAPNEFFLTDWIKWLLGQRIYKP
jgi:RHS repeat-associated protein